MVSRPGALGAVYVTAHVDTSEVPEELRKDAAAIGVVLQKEADKQGKTVGRRLNESIGREAKRAAPKVAGQIYRAIQGDLFKVARSGRLLPVAPLEREADNVGRTLGQRIAGGIASVGSGLADTFRSLGSSLGNVGSKGPLALLVGVGIIPLIESVIGLFIILGNVVAGLAHGIALIPGLIGLIGAAITPVIFAFHGLFTAISGAFAAKNAKELAAALSGLTPSAKGFVGELLKLRPFITQLQKVAQQKFFAQFAGSLTKAAKALGPTFLTGFGIVATAAGKFVNGLLKLGQDPGIKQFFAAMFQAAGVVLNAFGPAFTALFKGFAAVATASLPFLVPLLEQLAAFVKSFGDSLARSAANGGIKTFLDKFIEALAMVKAFGAASFNLLDALLGGPDEKQAAANAFQQIVDMINSLAAFFRTDIGRRGLRAMITLGVILVGVFADIVLAVVTLSAEVSKLIELIGDAISGYRTLFGLQKKVFSKIVPVTHGSGSGSGSFGGAPGHATGTISTREHMAMISEGNRPEVVIPLSDPNRARQLANASGLTKMMDNNVNVMVVIGDEQIQAKVQKWSKAPLKQFGKSMKYGPRPVGV
jgi:hypothetical protein